MVPCARHLRLVGVLMAASALQACNTPLNILAAIDGPYVSPEQRAEMSYQASQEARLAEERVALAAPTPDTGQAPVVTTTPITTPAPTPALAPAPTSAPTMAADPPRQELPPVALTTPLARETQAPPAPQQATRLGPDFLPPEPQAELQAEPPTPRPVAANVPNAPLPNPLTGASPGLMGPAATSEAPRAPLETRLPSAFDLTPAPPAQQPRRSDRPAPPSAAPAPDRQGELERAASAAGYSVVSALPEPAAGEDPAAAAGQSRVLRAFFDFAVARLDELPGSAASGRQSMLLAEPSSLDPELKRCGNLPPAVLIDLDPANGLMPLVSRDASNPELAGHLAQLRQRGVTVYWISGHGPAQASAIRRRLVAAGLDPEGSDPLIVTRFAGESKQERRYALGTSNCLLAIMGDQRADFDELYDFVLDPIMAAPLEEHLGHGWFLAPPPLD